jgi:hypothetical protein
MRRRQLFGLVATAAASPVRAQAVPVVGFLHSGTAEQNANRLKGSSRVSPTRASSTAGPLRSSTAGPTAKGSAGPDGGRAGAAAGRGDRHALQSAGDDRGAATRPRPYPSFHLARRPGGRRSGGEPRPAAVERHRHQHAERRACREAAGGFCARVAPGHLFALLNPSDPSRRRRRATCRERRARSARSSGSSTRATSARSMPRSPPLAASPGSALLINADPFFFVHRRSSRRSPRAMRCRRSTMTVSLRSAVA